MGLTLVKPWKKDWGPPWGPRNFPAGHERELSNKESTYIRIWILSTITWAWKRTLSLRRDLCPGQHLDCSKRSGYDVPKCLTCGNYEIINVCYTNSNFRGSLLCRKLMQVETTDSHSSFRLTCTDIYVDEHIKRGMLWFTIPLSSTAPLLITNTLKSDHLCHFGQVT